MALTKAEMSEYLFDKLSGFGNFDLRDKNQRPGRNPKTGEDIPITARRVVTFRPGQKLKSRVENASPKDK
ncbi:MAG: HU family DNA-binding protein [Klebsiella pneumoniae]|nr:HU family DNA-binding protein [Klebsiella pneumoniae]